MTSNSFEVDLFEVEPYDDPYVRTPLEWCRAGLHWEDLGMLTWLRSHQPGFQFNEAFIVKASPAGRDKVRAILTRLEKAGFLKRTKVRDTGGRIRGAKLTLRATADPVVAAMRAAQQPSDAPRTENPAEGTDQQEHAGQVLGPEKPSEASDQGKHGISAGGSLRTGSPAPVNPQQRKNTIKEPPPPTPSPKPQEAPIDAEARPEEAGEETTDHHSAAAALVAALPGSLTAGQRHRLTKDAAARLASGWAAEALTAELTADLDGVRSLAAVYRHRLAQLPDTPPRAQTGVTTVERPMGGEIHEFDPDPADPDCCRRCPRPKTNRIHTSDPDQISRTKAVQPAPGTRVGRF
ncbi:hypothetical protein [Glycomyces salinus]|uniref:hypothetical protein n=1 Tax=Glycomyces salinus TaxID=980294 RepID=UPI0018EABDF9|nr:hypothetical protein [Glycomyces salinus]